MSAERLIRDLREQTKVLDTPGLSAFERFEQSKLVGRTLLKLQRELKREQDPS